MSKIIKLIKQLRGTSGSLTVKPLLSQSAETIESFLKQVEELQAKNKIQQETIDSLNRGREEEKILLKTQKEEGIRRATEEVTRSISQERDKLRNENSQLRDENSQLRDENRTLQEQIQIMPPKTESPGEAPGELIEKINSHALDTIRNLECENFYIKQAVERLMTEVLDARGCYDNTAEDKST
jgi:FtsZ-binding cell division protein ZapB